MKELKVTHIGHATNLIEWNGFSVLTDPVFSERILFLKRKIPLGFDPAQLPKLSAILISHAHYDHLDLFSFKYIPSDVPIFIPAGMSKAIAPFVKNPVVELATWARFPITEGLGLCAVPAQHPGGRFLIPYRYRQCNGFVLSQGEEHLYFAGDTGYGDHFTKIRSLFSLKLALLPLAALTHYPLCRKKHLTAQDFIEAWKNLGRPDCIPIHWGLFFKNYHDPATVRQALAELQDRLHLLKPGESWTATSASELRR